MLPLSYAAILGGTLTLIGTSTNLVVSSVMEDTYEYFYQFKGRIIMTGLCGTLCVSEYSPGAEIFFNKEQIATFYTENECVDI